MLPTNLSDEAYVYYYKVDPQNILYIPKSKYYLFDRMGMLIATCQTMKQEQQFNFLDLASEQCQNRSYSRYMK